MTPFKQDERLLAIETPLGADKLLLEGFHGREEASRLFEFELGLLSEDDGIAPKDIVGKPVTVRIQGESAQPRFFHGYVSSFRAGPTRSRDFRRYTATVVPWLWFLTKASDCRIFQEKSVPEIVEAVFSEHQFNDFEMNVKGSYPAREYCVQYRETDFAFVSRLLEEVGIFYTWRHEDGKHTLVLADSTKAYQPCEESKVPYASGNKIENHVSSWDHAYSFVSGGWDQTDFDFLDPKKSLATGTESIIDVSDVSKFKRYDYPGGYAVAKDGDGIAQVRQEEEEAAFDAVRGSSTCRSFCLGGKFTLTEHDCKDEENKEYVLLSIEHSATDSSQSADGGGMQEYSNSFQCIPSSVVFRPHRRTPKAIVRGPQTAIVVGPSGEEIHTDEHGRVKVQFHWDRQGQANENSSCWVRVSQGLAGKGWGMIFIPRMGQEVVVDFLEGDPDRPLITGRVYNGEQTPPYDLPANKTRSGVKTRSTKTGDPQTFNEIRFEDKKGSEELYVHAEKDEKEVVENDQSVEIGHDQKVLVKNDRTVEAEGHEAITIGKTRAISVGEEHTESVGKDMSLSVGANRTMSVSDDLSDTVGGKHDLAVSKDSKTTIGGKHELDVAKESATTVAKAYTLDAKEIELTAQTSIKLKVGSATLEMKKNGDIKINGKKIDLKASGAISMKGSQIKQN